MASGTPQEGEEDIACAELMASRLRHTPHAEQPVVAAVLGSRAAARHRAGDIDFPPEDVTVAVAIDTFDFAMKAEWSGEHWIAKRYVPKE